MSKKLAITGNKLVDGLLATFISLILLGICLYVAKVYGSPVFWWQIFGGVLASIYVGLFAVGLLAGFSLFGAGFLLIVDWWYDKVIESFLKKTKVLEDLESYRNLFLTIIYIPTLLALVYLVAKGVIPYTDFLEFLKWFVLLIYSAVAGYVVGHFTK